MGERARQGEADRAERARAAGRFENLARAGEKVLSEVVALERAKAVIESDLLAAYGALRTIEAQQIDVLPGSAAARVCAMVSPDRVVSEEIALATGVGTGEVARRLALATAPRRHRLVLAALRAGATTLQRALKVASETAALCDADVAVVEQLVLAPSRDGQPVGQRTFMARLRRAVASVDGRGASERRAQAKARRGVFGRLGDDGMGTLTMTTDAATVAAIMDRLDTGARALRGDGDPRTLDQLRCDLATESLLRGHLAEHPRGACRTGEAGSSGAHRAQASSASGARGASSDLVDEPVPGERGPGERGPGERGAGVEWESTTGEAAARVWLVVPFEVATGASDAACELPGHGWITAAHAREVMTRPGSVWHTLPVDVRTGGAIGAPTRSYRPTSAMVEHVRAVDGTCRGPDCAVVASRCDLDHETPWPAGPTSVDNLRSKHRLHHNIKTDGIWTSRSSADGALEWTTLTGRRYATWPKNWCEGVDDVGVDGDGDPVDTNETNGLSGSGQPDDRVGPAPPGVVRGNRGASGREGPGGRGDTGNSRAVNRPAREEPPPF